MSSKQFTRQTFEWLRLLKNDRDTTALAVGLQLIEHFNEKEGGRAWPGTGKMAKALGLHEATVVRAVHRMHQRGRLRVEWGTQGRGHSNQYWMVLKDAPAQVLDDGKPAPASAVKPAPASKKPAPAHMNHLKNHVEVANATSTGERERSRALAISPGALAPEGGAPEEIFEVLLSIYQRPYGEDRAAAWTAFIAIYTPDIADEIIASAHRWVAARPPDKLQKLETWLGNGAWKKLPPPKQTRGKVSLAGIALAVTRDEEESS